MSESYDLRKMEDIFACLEVITMARGALYPVDPNLANRLEKVSDALSAFSLVVDETPFPAAGASPSVQKQAPLKEEFSLDAGTEKDAEPLDLLTDFPQAGKGGGSGDAGISHDEDDGIIDILTGEKIR